MSRLGASSYVDTISADWKIFGSDIESVGCRDRAPNLNQLTNAFNELHNAPESWYSLRYLAESYSVELVN